MGLRQWFLQPVLTAVESVRLSLTQYLVKEFIKVANDFTVLQKDLDAIKAGVTDLLAKVAALEGTNDQPTIDALAKEAQSILDAMNPPATPPATPPAPPAA